MLQELLPAGAFAFMMVFSRLGSAISLIPGFGETFVPVRIRLAIALAVSLVALPLVADGLPALPGTPMATTILITGEVLIGLFIGATARLTMAALHVGGTVIAFQSSLAYAQSFDPSQGSQGALIATFLTLLGLLVIFTGNLHLLALQAMTESYTVFPAAGTLPVGDFAETAVKAVAGAFSLGIKIAAPFIVYGLVFYFGLGLLNRLMPALQVFFVALPLQIGLGFFVLAAILPAALTWFLVHYEAALSLFLPTR